MLILNFLSHMHSVCLSKIFIPNSVSFFSNATIYPHGVLGFWGFGVLGGLGVDVGVDVGICICVCTRVYVRACVCMCGRYPAQLPAQIEEDGAGSGLAGRPGVECVTIRRHRLVPHRRKFRPNIHCGIRIQVCVCIHQVRV